MNEETQAKLIDVQDLGKQTMDEQRSVGQKDQVEMMMSQHINQRTITEEKEI